MEKESLEKGHLKSIRVGKNKAKHHYRFSQQGRAVFKVVLKALVETFLEVPILKALC